LFSLAGKNALVIGIANEDSIAFGCARAFRDQGAELAVTYQNDKAEPHVRPVAESLASALILPLDVRDNAQYEAVFERVRQAWAAH
jgi:enoyl-[acyl-carrier protein] reductase I